MHAASVRQKHIRWLSIWEEKGRGSAKLVTLARRIMIPVEEAHEDNDHDDQKNYRPDYLHY